MVLVRAEGPEVMEIAIFSQSQARKFRELIALDIILWIAICGVLVLARRSARLKEGSIQKCKISVYPLLPDRGFLVPDGNPFPGALDPDRAFAHSGI